MGRFGPRGGCLGGASRGWALWTHQPLATEATPTAGGLGEPCPWLPPCPHVLSHLGRCQLLWWVSFPPRGSLPLCPMLVWRQQAWGRTAQGHCWVLGRSLPHTGSTSVSEFAQALPGSGSAAQWSWEPRWPQHPGWGAGLLQGPQPPGREGGCPTAVWPLAQSVTPTIPDPWHRVSPQQ